MKLDLDKVEGAIFDIDGTLLDSMNTWFTVGVRYLKTLGIHTDESLGLILFSMTMTEAAKYMIKNFDLMNNELFREKKLYQKLARKQDLKKLLNSLVKRWLKVCNLFTKMM